MASKHQSKPKDQVQAILALATDLQDQLSHNDGSGTPNPETLASLEDTLHRLLLLAESIPTSTRRQLDDEGTKLWNIPVLRIKENKGNVETVLMCKVKALAYAMLDAASPMTESGHLRSLELAFRAIRPCIEHGLTDLGQKMIELAATRLDLLENSESEINAARTRTFTTEYYMLRIYLAWKQNRLDIADHLFSKVPETGTAEQWAIVVDICYTIGNSALSAGQYETARTWLVRAFDASDPRLCDDKEENKWFKDKRLSVLHAYARSNLQLTTKDSGSQLGDSVELLKTEFGDSFPVLALSLEVLSKDALNEGYYETIKSSIEYLGAGDTSLRIAYHYVTKLRSTSLERFVEACGQLLRKLASLDTSSKERWMEKILVSIIWALTSTKTEGNICPRLAEATAQVIADSGLNKPSEDATQASLILIWKHIDTMLSNGSFALAEQWCRFLLKQPLFQKSADTEAKSFRKLILCVLENYTPSSARQIFDEVPEDCKNCPLTLYLLYRLALLAEDVSLTTTYIQSLCKQDPDPTCIWACLSVALQLEKANIAMQNLRSVIAISDGTLFERLQIPHLLQYVICTVREGNPASHEDLLGQITSLLGSALHMAEVEPGQSFSSFDLRWFACKGYSIALELYKTSPPDETIKLLNASVKFMELTQQRTKTEPNINPIEHYLKCTFLQSMVIISEARRQKKTLKKEQYYKQARDPITIFKSQIQALDLDFMPDTNSHTWLDKYRIILSFDFEAAVYLRQWDDLAGIIEASKPIVGPKLSSVFLGCLLRSGAPSACLARVVKQIIRTSHSSPSAPLNGNTSTKELTEYLPRHLRVLFTLSIQAQEFILAESVLDHALHLAQSKQSNNSNFHNQSQSQGQSQPSSADLNKCSYPQDELHWLATSAFNRAVEFFLMSKDGECARWASKAIALADCIEEKSGHGVGAGAGAGELGRLLRTNLAKLGLKST
ncbi:meiosis protein SPO22/ZIP4 like-domain-containing protein [Aspergillus filifer]